MSTTWQPSGPELKKIVDALLSAFPQEESLEQMLAFELGETLGHLVPPGGLRARTLALVQWAIAAGRLRELLKGAQRANPSNADLAATVAWLDAQLAFELPAILDPGLPDRVPGTLRGAATTIQQLLRENHRIWAEFGPVSRSPRALFADVTDWRTLRATTIVPNNRRIADLVTQYRELFPKRAAKVLDRFLSHVDAFAVHVERGTDHGARRFPTAFAALIDLAADGFELEPRTRETVLRWLTDALSTVRPPLVRAYLFGSMRVNAAAATDVDVALLHRDEEANLRPQLTRLDADCQLLFGVPIDFVVFSEAERAEFEAFIASEKPRPEGSEPIPLASHV
jgi:hypothetical protein